VIYAGENKEERIEIQTLIYTALFSESCWFGSQMGNQQP
jgi:hypothetical protein